jgi:hypothetical protein
VRIGGGSAWWGDQIAPARALVLGGRLDYLCFETMAEVTISAAQVRRLKDPSFAGFETQLAARMDAVLGPCLERGTRIVSNQGWLNPVGAAELVAAKCREIGQTGVRIAAVEGSIVTDRIGTIAQTVMETGRPFAEIANRVVSAEVYAGMDGILAALRGGAQVVITGRVADPTLFAAPIVHEFGWSLDDWDLLGQAHGIGHLLECGAQVTGGYFPDPGFKEVPNPAVLGLPIAEVAADGSAIIEKLAGTGGAIDLRTVKEQMLYEVFNPAAYLTPDVVVDFTTVKLAQAGPDKVSVKGISGRPKPPTLKASIGTRDGFVGEDYMFYAGAGALDRARLAQAIFEERMAALGLRPLDIRFDLLGIDALHGAATPADAPVPYEIGLRVAARFASREEAQAIGAIADTMAVGGVGMTGKRLPGADRVREVVGVSSSLVPREAISQHVTWVVS